MGASDPSLHSILAMALQEVAAKWGVDLSQHVAVSLNDLSDASCIRQASHRGDIPIYPASVVKMFYLAAAHEWLKRQCIADTPELRRALREMIVHSSNDATHYVVDKGMNRLMGPSWRRVKERMAEERARTAL